jgi:hypothetical protein
VWEGFCWPLADMKAWRVQGCRLGCGSVTEYLPNTTQNRKAWECKLALSRERRGGRPEDPQPCPGLPKGFQTLRKEGRP